MDASETGAAPEVTILFPCLNEAETLGACVREARVCLDAAGLDGEILVSDNGSTDGSQDIARGLGARVVQTPERGYGAALMGGIRAARGRFVIMADSDLSYDLSSVGAIVRELRAGHALVMGNRFKGGILPGAMPWKNRHIGNPVLSSLARLFFRSKLRDWHCGLRGFDRQAILDLDLRTTGMEFASEMIVRVELARLPSAEVPTILRPDGRGRPPHLRPWRDGWRHLRFLLLFSPRWLFIYPALALMLACAIGVAALVAGPVSVGSVEFDVHTMIVLASGVVLGFQALLFGLLVRVQGVERGLQPVPEGYRKLFRHLSLERGIIASLLLMALGGALLAYATWQWRAAGLGHLDPRHGLRQVVPATLLLTLGGQGLLASFLFSIEGLKQRR